MKFLTLIFARSVLTMARSDRSVQAAHGFRRCLKGLPVALVALAFASSAFATENHPFENYDRRQVDLTVKTAGKPTTTQAVTPSAAAATATAGLTRSVPGVRVDRDPILNAPQFIASNRGFLTGPAGTGGSLPKTATTALPAATDGLQAVRAFVNTYQGLFGFGAEALTAARMTRDETTSATGLRTVAWQQELDGLPIFESIFKTSLSARGELINIGSAFLASPAAAADHGVSNRAAVLAKPAIGPAAALGIAAQNVGSELNDGEAQTADAPLGSSKRQHFQTSAHLLGQPEVELTWLPMDANTMRLCWRTTLITRGNRRMYQILVDAQTGEVLVRHNQSFDYTNATYNVFTGESPTPMTPGLANPSNTQPASVNRQSVTLPALSLNASPLGWINDGDNTLVGNNVNAHTDTNGDHVADANSSPTGSPNRVFDFPLDLTKSPADNVKAATTNLFYWCNVMHDTLYGYGFTEAAGNFQNDNINRGGPHAVAGDSVQAECQSSADLPASSTTRNNSFMSVDGTDGHVAYMEMFIWDGPYPDRDGCFDATVICHEYTHGLSNRLVGAGAGITQTASLGLGEGWSDFVALSVLARVDQDINGTFPFAAYVAQDYQGQTSYANYYYGVRRHPYSTDMNKEPVTFKDTDPNQTDPHPTVPTSPAFPTDPVSAYEAHNLGEVWCAALVEVRANLIRKLGFSQGNTTALQLVIDGMKLAPANPNFIQARDAIYQAETNSTHGDNRAELEGGFAKRGLGADATAPDSSGVSPVVESFRETIPPVVAVTVPAHNSTISDVTQISGTASDGDGSGIVPSQVHFTFYSTSSGLYWTGSGWTSTPTTLDAFLAADGTWRYLGNLPSPATAGGYGISAYCTDKSGNVSQPKSGVNNILFSVDSSSPTVTIAAPAANAVISQDGYGFNGTANDDVGVDRVQPAIRRESDGAYWTGSNWTTGITLLSASYNSGNHTWSCTSPLPALSTGLTPGAYTFIALAFDKASNSASASAPVTVDFAYHWVGADNADWGVSTNWSPVAVPADNDTVLIDNGNRITSSVNRTVRGFRLYSGSFNNFSVTVTGGPGTSVWGGGEIGNFLIVSPGASLTLDTTGTPYLNNGTLLNAGTVTVTASSPGYPQYLNGNYATVSNLSGGVLQLARDGFIFRNIGGTNGILNAGTVVKTAGAGTTDLGNYPLRVKSGGTLGASVGTLAVTAGAAVETDTTLAGPGTLLWVSPVTFSGAVGVTADLRFQSDMTFSNATLTQGVSGGQPLGRMRWDSSSFTGTLNLPASSTLEIDTTGTPYLVNATLNNAGTMVFSASSPGYQQYVNGNNATLNNLGGGLIRIARGDGLVFRNVGTPPLINNAANGLIVKNSANATTAVCDWVLENSGTVQVDAGALAWDAGSSAAGSGGIFTATTPAARVQFSAGTHYLKAGARFTGPGRGLLTGGTVSLLGAVNVGSTGAAAGGWEHTGGTLTGAGSLNVIGNGGTCTWTGGELNGTTYNLGAGATLVIDTTGTPYHNGATLNNAGTITFFASSPGYQQYLNGNNATLNNLSGGVVRVARDDQFLRNIGGTNVFRNQPNGLFVKTTAASGFSYSDWAVDNNGTMQSDAGTLAGNAGSTAAGSAGVFNATAAAARVEFSGGTHYLKVGVRFTGPGRGRLTGGTLSLSGAVTVGATGAAAGGFEQTGGTLTGAGSLSVVGGGGTCTWSGGLVSNTTYNLAAGATLAIDTTGTPYLGYSTLNNAGTITFFASSPGYQQYLNGESATLNNQNGGVVRVARDDQFLRNLGAVPLVNNQPGALIVKTTAASGFSYSDWQLDNNGTVQSDAGTLAWNAGSSAAGSTGTWTATAASARVEFSGGTHALKGGTILTGVGRTRITGGTVNVSDLVTLGASGSATGGFELTGGTVQGAAGSTLNHLSGGTFAWSGGTLAGTTLNISNGTVLAIDTTGTPSLSDLTLNNTGLVTLTASNPGYQQYLNGNSSLLKNFPGGRIELGRDGLIFRNVGTRPILVNQGTIVKTAGTGTTDFGDYTLQNAANASFGANVGTLYLGAPATFDQGSNLTGPGRVQLQTDLIMAGQINVAAETHFAAGTLTGSNALFIKVGGGSMFWDSGTFTGTLTIGAGLTLAIDTSPAPYLYNATFNNAGTVLLGASNLGYTQFLNGNNATFNNQAGGTFQITNSSYLRNVGAVPSFVNAGTVRLGPTPAILSSDWGYTQNGTGVLSLALAGTDANAPQFSQLRVNAAASLDGTLKTTLVSSYQPADASSFPVVTFTSRNGTDFATLSTPGLITGTKITKALSTTTVTLNASLTSYGNWRKAKFGANADNPAIAGAAADPNGDGIPNALAYAFNIDPLNTAAGDLAKLPQASTVRDPATGQSYLTMQYRQRTDDATMAYTVQVADSVGAAWDSSGSQLQMVGTPTATGDGVTQLVTVRVATPISASQPTKFMRVAVTVP